MILSLSSENDSDDVESNEFETAKQKILTILANLDDDSKQAVTTWLRTLHVDTGILSMVPCLGHCINMFTNIKQKCDVHCNFKIAKHVGKTKLSLSQVCWYCAAFNFP